MYTQIIGRTRDPVTGAVANEIVIDLRDPNSEYILQNINGLGPIKADVTSVDLVSESGSRVLGSRIGSRNIVFSLAFNPNWSSGSSVTELRRNLYSVFTPEFEVDFLIRDDVLGLMETEAIIETHDPDIFTRDPSVQISLLCHKPSFRLSGGGLTTHEPGRYDRFSMTYEGTHTVGFAMEATISTNMTDTPLIFAKPMMGGYVSVTSDWQVGDILRIQTMPGMKMVRRHRGGDFIPLLSRMGANMTDLKLLPGNNTFTFNRDSDISHLKIMYTQEYGGL